MKPKPNTEFTYEHTVIACFAGYVVQAIVNTFLPLLFLTLERQYQIPLSKITFLITFNFGFQLLIDAVSALIVDRIGYRVCIAAAHILSAAGLVCLTVLPECFPDPFAGILVSVLIYAAGGGLLEVLVSPILEACPTDNKEAAMSMLHSFYCWGQVAVVLLSTAFFHFAGIGNWKILALIWALVPALNLILFLKVPIAPIVPEDQTGMSRKELLTEKTFWILFVMMIAAGASEQAVSQWASVFAEEGLGVAKTFGDLAGPLFFAVMMGTSRALYGKTGGKIDLYRFMGFSALLCIAGYLTISFVPNPVIALSACGITGFSVGIFWPGTFSIAGAKLRRGGTLMYALLALAGDLGCSGGPTLAGQVAACSGDNLRPGILAAAVFPVLMLAGVFRMRSADRKDVS